ncbi:hypothetical protein [Chitinimonas sp.]|uniref:ribbon-helix-helix domain-containing protein n=1 Tax=Chitinimonas sp. TaxID=1934313 RepID=UPI0035B33BFC
MAKKQTIRTAPVVVTMPEDEKSALFQAAAADGRSASNFALKLIREGMERTKAAMADCDRHKQAA